SGNYTVIVTTLGCSSASSAATTVVVTPDAIAPAVTAPAAATVPQSTCIPGSGATPATSTGLSTFLAAATATDSCGTPTALPAQLGGSDITPTTFFPAGPNVVTFRFRDAAGNIGTATSTVTVRMYGDLNQDNLVNAMDLVIMANYLVGNVQQGVTPFTAPLTMADLNQDTQVNAVDLVILANYMVGNVTCLPTK
ncbi:MAG TPA: dockerin type I repeat-containing protein, partial [Thermoanaerobaculia bacterium]|nr:dockerin type I repeat-containing protein [Thermoanaerobaculia bacterium]